MAWPKGATKGPDGKPVFKANGAGNGAVGLDGGGENILDPAELGNADARADPADSGAGASKPASRKGSAPAAKKAKAVPVNVDGVSKILLAIHTSIAIKTRDELWLLDDKEAKMMAQAAADVAKHYDLGVADKYVAWGGLAYAASAVYGSRIVASMARSARAPSPTPPPSSGSAFDQLRSFGGAHAAH